MCYLPLLAVAICEVQKFRGQMPSADHVPLALNHGLEETAQQQGDTLSPLYFQSHCGWLPEPCSIASEQNCSAHWWASNSCGRRFLHLKCLLNNSLQFVWFKKPNCDSPHVSQYSCSSAYLAQVFQVHKVRENLSPVLECKTQFLCLATLCKPCTPVHQPHNRMKVLKSLIAK